MILVDILTLIFVAFLLLLLMAAASSLESLLWWAGWEKRSADTPPAALSASAVDAAPAGVSGGPEPDSYIVYLSGVGTMDPARMDEKEVNFLDLARTRLPGSALIMDVFPYSPTNRALTDKRWLQRTWKYVLRARKVHARERSTLQHLGIHAAQFRNVLQVAVSADRRYGPMYSYGVARAIIASLLRHGYRVGSTKPLILMVLSGAGQISVGCAPLLRRALGRPVWIISIGSIVTDDPGILDVEHLYHLSGSKDLTQHIGKVVYSGCWPIFPHSAVHQVDRQGKVTVIDVGPMKHMGLECYMSRSAVLPDGLRHVDKTVEVLRAIVQEIQTRAQQPC
jgi:hypothetical protein